MAIGTWREDTEENRILQNSKKTDYNKVINEAYPEPEPNTQYPHRPNYVGPSNLGKAGRAIEGDVVTAGLAYGTAAAAKPILKTIGVAGVVDAGINILTGESDTPFEKKLEIYRPAKVAVKGVRIFRRWLDDIFDKRVDKDYYADLYTSAENVWSTDYVPDDIRVIYNLPDISTELSSGKRIFPWENPSGMIKLSEPSPRGTTRDFAKRYNISGNTAGDIDLRNYDFQNNPKDYENFELLMQKTLQDDDIRVKDIPYFARERKTPIVGTRTEGTLSLIHI